MSNKAMIIRRSRYGTGKAAKDLNRENKKLRVYALDRLMKMSWHRAFPLIHQGGKPAKKQP